MQLIDIHAHLESDKFRSDLDELIDRSRNEGVKYIINSGFECLNSSIIPEAYKSLEEYAIRFSRIGKPIPNMKFKTASNSVHDYSLKNKIKGIIGENVLFISPLEMQIAYKLMLGKQ